MTRPTGDTILNSLGIQVMSPGGIVSLGFQVMSPGGIVSPSPAPPQAQIQTAPAFAS